MKTLSKVWIIVLAMMLVLPSLIACGDGSTHEPTQSTVESTSTSKPAENVVITIGNLTDITGPGAIGMAPINMALDDLVSYFNDEGMIPGVELRVIEYDGQLDPSRDIPGYEWLRQKGADLIFTSTPGTPVTLKTRADDDQVVVFGVSGDPDELSPPGYVFNLGTIPGHEGLTLLKWIAENDWDYQTKGPAKIGGAGWDDAYSGWWLNAMEDYANAHPEQFEWVDGYLTGIGTFTWGPEVEALKNCDYLFVPTLMANFVREYRNAGYSGRFIGASTHAAFFGIITDAGLWDEIEGMLFIASSRWWNETGEIIDLTKLLLEKYHSGSIENIIGEGVGYIATVNLYQMFSIIQKAVETTGAGAFDSQALYDAAQSYTLTIDDWDRYSFSETKRWATDLYAAYEASEAEKAMVRLHTDWLPVVTEP